MYDFGIKFSGVLINVDSISICLVILYILTLLHAEVLATQHITREKNQSKTKDYVVQIQVKQMSRIRSLTSARLKPWRDQKLFLTHKSSCKQSPIGHSYKSKLENRLLINLTGLRQCRMKHYGIFKRHFKCKRLSPIQDLTSL